MTGSRIRARDWGWQHAGRSAPALAGLDLDVEPGERLLLLGPSGAGKSTLLAALAGVLGGDEEGHERGELLVDGAHPSSRRGLAGLVLQDPQANTIMSRVGDDVAFGCENLAVPRDGIWPRVRDALDAVGLDVALDRSTAALSGGQRQRLALAGVIAMRPGLILLDEPTANLDPAGVEEVRDAVARVVAETGATLVVVEHRVQTWLPVVDRVVVLEPGGGAAADGSPEAVLAAHGGELAARGVWV
ncbi:ABC transporter ATP-binding protein, partial [Agrococcus sp. HG114]|uniref:ABC transporter ATP-binding protein n=1 Tax=Agrococcus sp. HG114 TaxID=2969757 RepID=UPI00215A3B9B